MRDCRVNHLQLTAPDAAAARHGARLVEDALRTISLAGESSRLVLVRRLALGALPANSTPALMAQRVEHALRAAPLQAVHAAAPGAAHAPAVYFADALEPYVLLAALGAAGHAPTAWFWPRAVPALPAPATPATAVRCALLGAAQTPQGPTAVAHIVASLHDRGLLDAALPALLPADGPQLRALCGWATPGLSQPASPAHPAHGQPPLPPTDAAVLRTWAARWGQADDRTHWLAAALVAASAPVLATSPHLSTTAAAWLAAALHAGPLLEQPSQPDPPRRSATPSTLGVLDNPAPAHGPAAAMSATGPAKPRPGPAPASQPAPPPPRTNAAALPGSLAGDVLPAPLTTPEPAAWWHGLPLHCSAAAGAWLLVRLLGYLGLPAWLRDHPAAPPDLGSLLLADACHRLAVPLADAIWLELPPGAPPAQTAALVSHWRMQIDDWFAGQPDLSPAALVRCPGWTYATRTHLDVFYDLQRANPVVRRLGLDLDPGWTPWLARVITLHYAAALPPCPPAPVA